MRTAAPQYFRTFRRSYRRGGLNPRGMLAAPDPSWLFVVGSPRSGTSFTAEAVGRVDGVHDLGEVPRLKAELPGAYGAVQAGRAAEAERRLQRVLRRAARVGMGGNQRCLEQTPESTYLIEQLAEAFPAATFVHLIRDGRDVAASLIDRGWLATGAASQVVDAAGTRADDAGQPYGDYARFWVEPALRAEFERADEARRCAWAWRRYETAARDGLAALPAERSIDIRYEDLVQDPAATAERVAARLDMPERTEQLAAAFAAAHGQSVGRYRSALTADQLAAIEREAGGLLAELGYR